MREAIHLIIVYGHKTYGGNGGVIQFTISRTNDCPALAPLPP